MNTSKKANSKEFLTHAFNIMMLLKAKAISVEEAKEQANLLKQSNNILRYELDKAMAIAKFENLNLKDIESYEEG